MKRWLRDPRKREWADTRPYGTADGALTLVAITLYDPMSARALAADGQGGHTKRQLAAINLRTFRAMMNLPHKQWREAADRVDALYADSPDDDTSS